jgi:hypothetical protein
MNERSSLFCVSGGEGYERFAFPVSDGRLNNLIFQAKLIFFREKTMLVGALLFLSKLGGQKSRIISRDFW